MKLALISIIACFGWTLSNSQVTEDIESIFEDWVSLHNPSDVGVNNSELYNELIYWINNPIDLNMNKIDLDKTPFLTAPQKNSIATHLSTYSALIEIKELLSLPHFTTTDVRLIELITFTSQTGSSRIYEQRLDSPPIKPTYQVALSYNRKLERTNPNYLGSPDGVTFRLRSRGEFFESGITMQKDPGELLVNPKEGYTPDFLSGFISHSFKKKPIYIIAGDFKLQFGQGLHYWNGFTPWINALIPTIERHGRELSPYTSALETNLLRGVALTTTINKWTFTPFISSINRDARIDKNDPIKVNYLLSSGYHRTETELIQKKNLRESLAGLRIRKSTHRGYIGSTLSYLQFNKYLKNSEAPYKQLNFSGNSNPTFGLDYASYFKNASLFGEVVFDNNYQYRILNGMNFQLGQQLNLSGSLYRLSSQLFAPNSNPWAFSSSGSNEQGINLGYSLLLFSKLNLSGFSSYYSTSFLTFRADAPTKNSKIQHQITYVHNDQISTYFRFTTRRSHDNYSEIGAATKVIEEIITRDFRLHFNVTLSYDLKWQTQIDYRLKTQDLEQASGYLFFTSFRQSIPHSPIKIAIAYSVSDGSPLSGAFYTSTATLPYEFGSISHSSQSNHLSAMIKVKLLKSISFWFRVSQRLSPGSQAPENQSKSHTSISTVLKCQF